MINYWDFNRQNIIQASSVRMKYAPIDRDNQSFEPIIMFNVYMRLQIQRLGGKFFQLCSAQKQVGGSFYEVQTIKFTVLFVTWLMFMYFDNKTRHKKY